MRVCFFCLFVVLFQGVCLFVCLNKLKQLRGQIRIQSVANLILLSVLHGVERM